MILHQDVIMSSIKLKIWKLRLIIFSSFSPVRTSGTECNICNANVKTEISFTGDVHVSFADRPLQATPFAQLKQWLRFVSCVSSDIAQVHMFCCDYMKRGWKKIKDNEDTLRIDDKDTKYLSFGFPFSCSLSLSELLM